MPGRESLNLLGQTAAVSEVLLGDKLAAFQEAAEKANEIPEPVKIPDPAAEPTVTILWSESDKLQDGEIMPLSVANRVFEKLDTASTRTGKRTATRAAGTTRPHSVLILP